MQVQLDELFGLQIHEFAVVIPHSGGEITVAHIILYVVCVHAS